MTLSQKVLTFWDKVMKLHRKIVVITGNRSNDTMMDAHYFKCSLLINGGEKMKELCYGALF